MNISNYYWYFTSAIPPRICDDIIKYGLSQAETMARTGGYGDRELSKQEIKDIKRKRNSDLVWLNDLGFIKKYNLMLIKQIEMQVGILNGIDQSLVSLQNIN
jgi:hypothetical protein